MSALETTVEAIAPSIVAPAATSTGVHAPVEQPSLRNTVTNTMEKYFNEMAGHPIADVYEMVLVQVETPLLTSMMRFTRGNQSRSAVLLGLSRGTLRKKLKKYDLENIHVTDSHPAMNDSGETTSLHQVVASTINPYLSKMKGQPIADVYEMVLSEVEEPLLMAMMKFTRGNQSRAAILFGLSRGTLRKKLKKYGLD